MFIYSLRASTLKFFAVICVALVTLITLIAFIPTFGDATSASADTLSKSVSYNFEKIKSNDDRVALLSQFGWTVKNDPVQSVEVTIPSSFDKIFTGYNEIQRRQGLDLSKYKNKNVMRYTYEVTNYDGYEGTVYANVLVYRNRVVGGDICSADVSGFIHGFVK
ncbi:MAG: DUF4830 domain-containing protein [Eubacteriales bacterium]